MKNIIIRIEQTLTKLLLVAYWELVAKGPSRSSSKQTQSTLKFMT